MKNCNSYLIFLLLLFSSCTTDDRKDEPATSEVNLTGTWKLDHYEVRGKIYQISQCDGSDLININVDKTGSYVDSELNSSSNTCNNIYNLAGQWNYISEERSLRLVYNENNIKKIKTFQIETASNTEIRILNSSKVIQGSPSSNEVLEIWRKF